MPSVILCVVEDTKEVAYTTDTLSLGQVNMPVSKLKQRNLSSFRALPVRRPQVYIQQEPWGTLFGISQLGG